jgi:hypothetical protein
VFEPQSTQQRYAPALRVPEGNDAHTMRIVPFLRNSLCAVPFVSFAVKKPFFYSQRLPQRFFLSYKFSGGLPTHGYTANSSPSARSHQGVKATDPPSDELRNNE